jgi:hypothetical protein
MEPNYLSLRKTAATLLLLFPIILMLAFAMHFNSIHNFFNFHLTRDAYDAGKLFDALTTGRGHGFIMAHTVGFVAIPLFFVTIFTLSGFLYIEKPALAIVGLIAGIIGCTAIAAVFGAWLSFSGISTVDKSYTEGARAGFIELVRMKGMLKFFTLTSYLSFISIIILAAGLIWVKKFKVISMLSLVIGAALFVVFMDMDNWMFIGALLLLLGFLPVSKKLREV